MILSGNQMIEGCGRPDTTNWDLNSITPDRRSSVIYLGSNEWCLASCSTQSFGYLFYTTLLYNNSCFTSCKLIPKSNPYGEKVIPHGHVKRTWHIPDDISYDLVISTHQPLGRTILGYSYDIIRGTTTFVL